MRDHASIGVFVFLSSLQYLMLSLKLRYWWKIPESLSCFKTSRHVQQQQVKPLCSQTWNIIKTMGLLRRFRGIRKPQNTSHIFPIQPMIATNFEFEYSETRTTHPRRANFNNLINIQLDTSKDNSGATQSEPGMRENNGSFNSKHCDFALFTPGEANHSRHFTKPSRGLAV